MPEPSEDRILSAAGSSVPPGTAAERIELWLRDTAFPFWAAAGVDTAGPGFVEHLTLDGRPADVPYKRVRVQARQIYCFCQAADSGWHPDGVAIAQRGIDLLLKSAWQGRERGWVSTLTRDGAPLQRIPDLYDIAFVLFALAWWHRVTGDPRVTTLGCETLDFLTAHMRHPSGRGYLHRLHGEAPHLQNPHMHLTEAMIALRDTTGHARFAEEADTLVKLCLDHFLDGATLAEEFNADWGRDPHPRAAEIEPGHHYEWVWLLHGYLGPGRQRSDIEAAMGCLFDFATRFGQSSKTGLVLDAVYADGSPAKQDHRLWPQAERLKGWLAMAERHGVPAKQTIETGTADIFRFYLDTQPPGTWVEHRTPELTACADKIPTSSFYHVVLAFAEVLRLRHLVEGSAP